MNHWITALVCSQMTLGIQSWVGGTFVKELDEVGLITLSWSLRCTLVLLCTPVVYIRSDQEFLSWAN